MGFVSASLSTLTMPIGAPSCRFSTAPPVPVVTIVSSSTTLSVSAICTRTESFAGTVTACVAGRKPRRCVRTDVAPAATPRMMKCPRWSLEPTSFVPVTEIKTPSSGCDVP